jgi:hypothetical protein
LSRPAAVSLAPRPAIEHSLARRQRAQPGRRARTRNGRGDSAANDSPPRDDARMNAMTWVCWRLDPSVVRASFRGRSASTARRRIYIVLAAAVAVAGCASSGWFHRGPRPAELVGTWVDSAATTPSDTTLWILASDGSRRIVRHGAGEAERDQWYVDSRAEPRALFCFVRRSRDAATCAPFELDLAPMPGGVRRRLVVRSYDPQSDRTWVLLARGR